MYVCCVYVNKFIKKKKEREKNMKTRKNNFTILYIYINIFKSCIFYLKNNKIIKIYVFFLELFEPTKVVRCIFLLNVLCIVVHNNTGQNNT